MKTPNVGALWVHEVKDEVTGNEHVYMTGYLDFGVFGRVKIIPTTSLGRHVAILGGVGPFYPAYLSYHHKQK